MKLKKEFIAYKTNKEYLLVPTGRAGWAGLVQGNKTLGAVLELLKTDTSEEEIVKAMRARFNAPEAVIAADVQKALTELRRIGALDE